MQESRPYTFDRVVRSLITIGILLALIWLTGYLSDVLIPFAVALVLAYLTNPLVSRTQRLVRNRAAAVIITLVILLGILALVVWLVLPMIIREGGHIGRILSDLVHNSALTGKVSNYIPEDLWQAVRDFAGRPDIQEMFKPENFWKVAKVAAQKMLPGLWGVLAGAAGLILGLVGLAVIALYMVFLLLDYDNMRDGWQGLVPASYREQAVEFVSDLEYIMNRYFRGQAAVAGICGILFALGFYIIGLPLGILLGLFIGMLNMVPYLQLIGLPPAILLAVFQALDTGTSVWVILGLTGLVFVLVQVIQDIVLVPKIMGKVTGFNPAVIMLSLSVWGKLLGLLGLIIALPMTYLILAYYRRFLASGEAEGSG
ncbi:MAG: AI-2E family transporter [Deltaproteobacteria bacterium]|nr:AI-2E family transporter [Deltaproteobacteria bacterium]